MLSKLDMLDSIEKYSVETQESIYRNRHMNEIKEKTELDSFNGEYVFNYLSNIYKNPIRSVSNLNEMVDIAKGLFLDKIHSALVVDFINYCGVTMLGVDYALYTEDLKKEV